jgi:hypothetical protein
LVTNGVPHRARNADAGRLGQPRKARGNIADVAVEHGARLDQGGERVSWQRGHSAAYQIVAAWRHVTNFDADAERHPLVWRWTDIAVGHAALQLDGARHRVDRAIELDEQAVAGRPYDATIMFRNYAIYQLVAMCLLRFDSASFLRSDRPWAIHHLSGEHCNKTAGSSHYWNVPLFGSVVRRGTE